MVKLNKLSNSITSIIETSGHEENSKLLEGKNPENPTEISESSVCMKPFQIAFKSDIGKVRTLDEDAIAVIDASGALSSDTYRKIFAVVADGMGGANKGEIASYLAVKTISENIFPYLSMKNLRNEKCELLLKESFVKANEVVIEKGMSGPEYRGMGTTASALIVDGKQLTVAHVGDTRVYVIRKGQIEQITKDHSYVQTLIDSGKITQEKARRHPRKNEITRAVGISSHIEVDTYTKTLEKGDYILLCCDGLVNELVDFDILEKVISAENLQSACTALVDAANQHGGNDNISLIIMGPMAIP
jgi:PPM family protein phosphatase